MCAWVCFRPYQEDELLGNDEKVEYPSSAGSDPVERHSGYICPPLKDVMCLKHPEVII